MPSRIKGYSEYVKNNLVEFEVDTSSYNEANWNAFLFVNYIYKKLRGFDETIEQVANRIFTGKYAEYKEAKLSAIRDVEIYVNKLRLIKYIDELEKNTITTSTGCEFKKQLLVGYGHL